MDQPIQVAERIFWVGVNDRETDLFESMWPLPHGISYNAYLIVDDRIVLVDAVKAVTIEGHLAKLKSLLPAGRGVDCLVINHLEPDHAGSVRLLRDAFPHMEIIGSNRTVEFIGHLFGITQNVRGVADGEELPTGGSSLRFVMIPMVHWPETMATYDVGRQVLFSGDAFGGYGALEGALFDDQVDLEHFEAEAVRYFANIVAKYGVPVQKAIAKLSGIDAAVVAPSHGPVWRTDPGRIVSLYDSLSSLEAREGVTVAYGTMYANTAGMMEAVARGLAEGGVKRIRVHDLSRSHPSYVLADCWRYRGLVLGSPTYEAQLFPPMDHLVRLLESKKLGKRLVGIFGTYGWSGGGVAGLRKFQTNCKLELVEPVVEARFAPKEEGLQNCYALGRNMAARLTAPRDI